MKTNRKTFSHLRATSILTMVLVVAIGFVSYAQPGAPPPPPGGPGGPGGPRPQPLQTVSAYQGNVVRMATNDDYVYDGFYIIRNGDSVVVKFPPHLGSQVAAVVQPGTNVTVNGVLNVAPRGEQEIRMVSITAGGKTIADTGAPPTDNPPAETYTSGSGKVSQLQTNREGEVNGVIVDGKTILRVPPHIARQLASLVNGATISYTGMKKASNNGEAMASDYTVVHCKTITVNGQQYLVE